MNTPATTISNDAIRNINTMNFQICTGAGQAEHDVKASFAPEAADLQHRLSRPHEALAQERRQQKQVSDGRSASVVFRRQTLSSAGGDGPDG